MANATPDIKTRPDKLPRDSIMFRHPSGQAEVRGQIVKASRTMVNTMGSHCGKEGSGSASEGSKKIWISIPREFRLSVIRSTGTSSPGSSASGILRQEGHDMTRQEGRYDSEYSPGSRKKALRQCLGQITLPTSPAHQKAQAHKAIRPSELKGARVLGKVKLNLFSGMKNRR